MALLDLWPLLVPAALYGLFLYLRALWGARPRRYNWPSPPPKSAPKAPAKARDFAVIDGSNVMHWREEKPDLAPVRAAIQQCKARGFKVGVIFDANAGYKLYDRYLPDHVFAKELGLPKDQVFVVPKGQQADPFLLDFANEEGGIIISNDRFRDRLDHYPNLNAPGRLVRGRFQSGQIQLDL